MGQQCDVTMVDELRAAVGHVAWPLRATEPLDAL